MSKHNANWFQDDGTLLTLPNGALACACCDHVDEALRLPPVIGPRLMGPCIHGSPARSCAVCAKPACAIPGCYVTGPHAHGTSTGPAPPASEPKRRHEEHCEECKRTAPAPPAEPRPCPCCGNLEDCCDVHAMAPEKGHHEGCPKNPGTLRHGKAPPERPRSRRSGKPGTNSTRRPPVDDLLTLSAGHVPGRRKETPALARERLEALRRMVAESDRAARERSRAIVDAALPNYGALAIGARR
jgi:hypothetical protein